MSGVGRERGGWLVAAEPMSTRLDRGPGKPQIPLRWREEAQLGRMLVPGWDQTVRSWGPGGGQGG